MDDAKKIGLHVHQATISVAILDSAGKLVMQAILETKAQDRCFTLTTGKPQAPWYKRLSTSRGAAAFAVQEALWPFAEFSSPV